MGSTMVGVGTPTDERQLGGTQTVWPGSITSKSEICWLPDSSAARLKSQPMAMEAKESPKRILYLPLRGALQLTPASDCCKLLAVAVESTGDSLQKQFTFFVSRS